MSKKNLFWTVLITSCIIMVLADFGIIAFFEHQFSGIILRVAVAGLIFIASYSIIIGQNARCFSLDYFRGSTEDEYIKRLKHIGSIPIRTYGLNMILHLVFLSILIMRNSFLGINPEIKIPLFLTASAIGLLVGTFIYVTSEGLVCSHLMSCRLNRYPRSYRNKRQGQKFLIIPLAVSLTSLLFASGVMWLSLYSTGDVSGQGGMSIIIIPYIIFLIGLIVLAIVLKRNCCTVFDSVIEQLENLSSENKDLTKRISIGSVDELGTIGGMVNAFCEQMNAGIREIKESQEVLSRLGSSLEANASGMADSTSGIAKAAEQVLAKTKGQQDNIHSSSGTIQQMNGHSKTLEETINSQISSMEQASAAVEQMVGNISSIGSVTAKMAAQFETVGEAAKKGIQIQKESGNRIQEIVQESQALQEANKIIATITAQTNLLAMNAAIEAAHAGDAGRGFSVVADEIRKLAENSSVESKKINLELKQIITTIDHIVKDAEASGTAFAEVSRRISDTEKLVIEVDNAVQEQKIGAGQVMDSLKEMNDLAAKVCGGSQVMSQGSEAVLQEIDALQSSAGEIETRMEEMSGNIKNINTGAQEVYDSAASAKSSIQKITVITGGFKV